VADHLSGEGVQVGLVARRDLQGRGLDLDEVTGAEPSPDSADYAIAREEERPAVCVPVGIPPGRCCRMGQGVRPVGGGEFAANRYRGATRISSAESREITSPPPSSRDTDLKVAASSLRKGAVVDMEGKLYVVLTAENIHPGKGTPVTQLNMRRISDGVKVSERWRTTEQVERAFVDDRNFTFLYQDGEGFHFMNPESYDQVVATPEVVGDAAIWLQDGMTVTLSTHEGVPIALELPRLVTLDIVETEPAVKNQTASSSYKPAILSNGARIMVPPYIAAGTRVVILTEDGSYQERAKD
jgi:elongation factor P